MSLKIKTASSELNVVDGFGHSLLQLAQNAGLHVNASCAGGGVCGGCTVILERGQYIVAGQQVTASPGNPPSVLSCQAMLACREAQVRFPRSSIVEADAKIDEDFSIGQFDHEAQAEKYTIEVPLARVETRYSVWDLIRIELQQQSGHRDFAVPIQCLQKLPGMVREDQRQLTVTLGHTGRHLSVIDIEPGDTTTLHFGVAVDIGTTTVVAMLVDLNQGHVLNKASLYNQQIRRADDVASRISHCQSPENVRELQRLVVEETINPLVETLCSRQAISHHQISRIAVSGNTVMMHLLLGISPEGIGQVPFQPVANRYDEFRAGDLQLRANSLAIVDIVPSVSGYVGGDIVSDIYVARLTERREPTLLVDIGTNGEIVYAEDDHYTVCATAAGPAFEGYGTAHGCRAATGAIEHVAFGSDLQFELQVIGEGPVTGLCGSALIDFIAHGMRCGLINRMGRYNIDALQAAGRYLRLQSMCGAIQACVIVDAEESAGGMPIYVSEADLAQILKAKAAIYAGMKTLLGDRNRNFADIERFCLAGGFARHLDLHCAVAIGLLPDIPLDRFDVLGNGSLAGAMLALTNADAMGVYETVAQLPDVLELNRIASFENHFIDALALPNVNADEFPSVMKQITTSGLS